MKMRYMYSTMLLASICSCLPAQADTNVALGASVSYSGSGFGNSNGWCCGNFQPGSIVNGTPQADGTQWNAGTAFWSGGTPDTTDVLTITLAQTAVIDSIQLQADDNDAYTVSYRNGSSWVPLFTYGQYGSWGLITRPVYSLLAPITTNAFEITAGTGRVGDGDYAVGQFWANGSRISAVPEPRTYMMLLAGLGFIGFIAARQKKNGTMTFA